MIYNNGRYQLANNFFRESVCLIFSKYNNQAIHDIQNSKSYFLYNKDNFLHKKSTVYEKTVSIPTFFNGNTTEPQINRFEKFTNWCEKNKNSENNFQVEHFNQDGILHTLNFFKKEIINESFLSDKHKKGFFVHMRCGDVAIGGELLVHYDYFDKAISRAIADGEDGQGFISSDIFRIRKIAYKHITELEKIQAEEYWLDIQNKLIKKYNLELFDNTSAQETIIEASKYRTKILSTGTFTWLIGFLGSQNVYYPEPTRYKKWFGGGLFDSPDWISV